MRGSAAFRVAVAPGGALAGPWVQNSLWTAARAVPSLDLRFADNKSLVDATTGASLVTFTRASSGTFVGSDGLVKTAVTNLSLRSQELGDAAWTKTLSSITADATIAPNGTTTADKLVEDSSTGTHNIVEAATITYTNGLAYTFSFFIKKAERQTVQIVMNANPFPGGLGTRTAVFNSNTGAFVSVGSAYTGSSVTAFSDGWYRVSVSSTSDATATGNFAIALCSDDIGTSSYTGDGTSGLFLWGAQLEQSSTVGEYIPTTSTINSAPRFDHNPTTGESLGLLVEEARTNLLLRSEEFDNAGWTKASATITANESTAPDGTSTADLWTNTGSPGSISQNYTKDATARTYSGSIWVKSSVTAFTIAVDDGSNSNRGRAQFNIETGVLNTAVNVGTFTNTSATITAYPDSWYRVTVTTTTSTGTTVRLITFFSNIGATARIWGAQLEENAAFVTSYIPTTTATVTRAADVASITGSNFSSFYNQTEGTVFADARTQQSAAAHVLAGVSTSSFSSSAYLSKESSNFLAVAPDAAPSNLNIGLLSVSSNVGLRAALAFTAGTGSASAVMNGGTVGTDASTGIPITMSQMGIGCAPWSIGANLWNGTIKRLAYWPVRLVNTLQAITQ